MKKNRFATAFLRLSLWVLFALLSPAVFAAALGTGGLVVDVIQSGNPVGTRDVRAFGDEFYQYYEIDVDGRACPVVKRADGWYYATLSPDGSEWVATSQSVLTGDAAAAGGEIIDEARARFTRSVFDRSAGQTEWYRLTLADKLQKQAAAGLSHEDMEPLLTRYNTLYGPLGYSVEFNPEGMLVFTAAGSEENPALPQTRGAVNGLTLLVSFPGETILPEISDVNALNGFFNDDPGTAPFANIGSVRSYFLDHSTNTRGLPVLDYSQKTTLRYVEVPQTRSYYESLGAGEGAKELLADCVNIINQDFDQYLPDTVLADLTCVGASDRLRSLSVIYHGAMGVGGLWPQTVNASDSHLSLGRYTIGDFVLAPLGGADRRNSLPAVGLMLHEMAHVICAVPDAYDYGSGIIEGEDFFKSAGIGSYCLMSSGAFLQAGRAPAAINPLWRINAGWLQVAPQTYTQNNSILISPDIDEVPIVVNPRNAHEFFIFQNINAAATGASRWNVEANQGGGLAVWHADNSPAMITGNECQQRTGSSHFQLALLQMDGAFDLENNQNGGDGRDLLQMWDSINGAGAVNTRWWNREQSLLIVTYEAMIGESIRFSLSKESFSAPPENVLASQDRTDGIEISWDSIAPNFRYTITRYDKATGLEGRIPVATEALNISSFVDRTAIAGRHYYYTLIARENDPMGRPSVESTPRQQGLRLMIPPINVIASQKFSDRITLSWDAAEGSRGYKVYRANSPIDTPLLLTPDWTMNRTYTDLAIQPGAVYYYTVTATAQMPSTILSISLPSDAAVGATVLAAPENVATENSNSGVKISWDASKGANFYRVYRAPIDSVGEPLPVSGWISLLTYMDKTPAFGISYYYYVRASANAAGDNPSAYSKMGQVAFVKLFSPKNLTATENLTEGVDLAWSAVEGATHYNIYRSLSPTDRKPLAISGWIQALQYRDVTAFPGQKYYYFACAATSENGGTPSDYYPLPSTGETTSVYGIRKLSPPAGLTASQNMTEGVALSWRSVSGASYYQVSRSESENGIQTVISDWQNTLTFKDVPPHSGVGYFYSVASAQNVSGDAASSVSKGVEGIRVLQAPSSMKASSNAEHQINLSWVSPAPDQDLYFDIYRSESTTGSFVSISRVFNDLSYVDGVGSGIAPGKYYDYYVIARSGMNGIDGLRSQVVTGALASPPPTNLTATDSLRRQVALSWDALPGTAYYQVLRGTDSPVITPKAISPWLSQTQYIDLTVNPSDSYYYSVHAALDPQGITAGMGSPFVFGRALPEYQLTVNSGSGSNYYEAGNSVEVIADAAPNGYRFYQWVSDSNYGADTSVAAIRITMPSHSVTITAVYLQIPAVGVLSFSQNGYIGESQTLEAILTFNRPLNEALAVPLKVDSAYWISSGNPVFSFKAGESQAAIRLKAASFEKTVSTVLGIDKISVQDFELPAQSVSFNILPNEPASRYAIVYAPLYVTEGQILVVEIAGPKARILHFSIVGLSSADYRVLGAQSLGGGKFSMDGAAVTRTGIRIQILNRSAKPRLLTLSLTGSTPEGLITADYNRSCKVNVIGTDDAENVLAVMNWSQTLPMAGLMPNASSQSVKVLGSYDKRNPFVSVQTGLISTPDSVSAPLGWMSVLGYGTTQNSEGQARVYFGSHIGYRTAFNVRCCDLGVDSLVAFNARPVFKLTAYDPFKDPAGLKNPKRSGMAIVKDTWEVGARQITVNCGLNMKLYDKKALSVARRQNRFYADLDSSAVVSSIGAELLMNYKDKELDLSLKEIQVGAILLSSPEILRVDSPILGVQGFLSIKVFGNNFGPRPKVSLEYSNGSQVRTLAVKTEVLDDGLPSVLRLTLPKRPTSAASDRFYLLIDSGVGITAIPFVYPKSSK